MGLNKDILILGLNVEWTSGPPLTAKTNIVEANSPNYSESSVLLGIHCIILTKKYVYCWAFKKHIFKSKFLTIWIISNQIISTNVNYNVYYDPSSVNLAQTDLVIISTGRIHNSSCLMWLNNCNTVRAVQLVNLMFYYPTDQTLLQIHGEFSAIRFECYRIRKYKSVALLCSEQRYACIFHL